MPADVDQRFPEARSCRPSHDHDLRYIRVLTSESAREPYVSWSATYPAGATLVKLEYQDADCTELLGYTAMLKLAPGTAPEEGDWLWQRLDARRVVLPGTDVPSRCLDCHRLHCREPYGYDLACGENLPF